MIAQTLTIGADRPDWHVWLVLAGLLVALYQSASWLVEVHQAERASR